MSSQQNAAHHATRAARRFCAALCFSICGWSASAAIAAENVAGLAIDHVRGFKANKAMAGQGAERTRAAQSPVVAIDAFEAEAPWADKQLTGAVYVVRTRYQPGFKRTLDAVVQETFDDITAKYGDKAGVLMNKRVRVYGLDAQRMSFALQVDDLSVGAETLVLQSRAQDVIWIVQVVFDESTQGAKGAPDKEARRLKAAQIVESVRVAARTHATAPAPAPARKP